MTDPHVTAVMDQLGAECADMTADELAHALAHFLRITMDERLHPQASTPRDLVKEMDAALCMLSAMVIGWLGGRHHTCTKRHADSPFGE